jgi:hypothetical protein
MNKSSQQGRTQETGAPILTSIDLARLGDGKIAYIKAMTSDEAQRMFPAVEGLPEDMELFALHGADGTPLALTDSHFAAIGHAISDKLEVASLH